MEPKFSLSRHALSGALFAALVGAIWVQNYLAMTVADRYSWVKTPVLDYVTGAAHNLEEMAVEALFIVVARFLLAFGFSWLPLTALIAGVRALAKGQ